MTCREKLAKEHPEYIREDAFGGCLKCPYDYGYVKNKQCVTNEYETPDCTVCWDQEVNNTEATQTTALYADDMQIDIHKIIDDAMEKSRVRYRCSNCKTIINYAPHFCSACGEEMHGCKEVEE